MNKPNADIELIRKYFNGELSPADQYELEKRALDDPFLQDAMDGFEHISVNQKAFDELDNRLAERLKEKDKVLPIWGFKHWSIAASLIIGIAAISIYLNQTPENKPIAVSEIQKKERLPKSVRILEDTIVKDDVIGLLESSPTMVKNDTSTSAKAKTFTLTDEFSLQALAKLDETAIKDSVLLNEVRVVGYSSQAKREITGSVSRFNAEEVAKLKSETALSGRASGVTTIKLRGTNTDQIVGKVTSIEDGSVLPGVQIINTSNGKVAVSNSKGEFKIQADEKDQLIAKYIGFLTETIAVNKDDSLYIALKQDEKALSEVVVVDYGNKKPAETFAQPKGGWKEFRKYLEDNSKLNTGDKGRVVVQFYIQPNGKLIDFSIQKGLNTIANNKAIQLIKAYQPWYGASDGKTQKVKVAIRFR